MSSAKTIAEVVRHPLRASPTRTVSPPSYKGYLGGIHLGFDPAKQQLSKINYAMGYQATDFQFHGAVNDAGENYVAHVYQRLSDKTETGVMLSWTQSTK